MTKRYKQLKAWRTKNKNNGFCVDCSNKAEEGRIRCRYHLDVQAEKVRERRLRG